MSQRLKFCWKGFRYALSIFHVCLLILQTFIEYQYLQGPAGEHKDAGDMVLPTDIQPSVLASNCISKQGVCPQRVYTHPGGKEGGLHTGSVCGDAVTYTGTLRTVESKG